jgi:hypothetical protein
MTHGKTIRDFYAEWEKRDWDAIARTLADDFIFTSPHDAGLNQIVYKEKCWPGADSVGTYDFLLLWKNETKHLHDESAL